MSEPDVSQEIVQIVISEDPPDRLDKALARDAPEGAGLSRSRLARLIAGGAVSLDGQPETSARARVAAGQVWDIALEAPEPAAIVAEAIPLSVVFEDTDLIVIDKPAGMVVHPAPGSPRGTLVNALMHHCGDDFSAVGAAGRPGIVHRIDKDTSGLLVVAKTDKAHQGLSAQFADHSVHREYRALVHGVPDAGDPRLRGIAGVGFEAGGVLCIRAAIDRHRADRQRMAVVANGGRAAVTRARVDARFGTPAAISLLTCWLETGRTHQIRVHLSHVGHGLIGDPVYGGRRRIPARALPDRARSEAEAFPRQALHAATLGFDHPVTGEALRFASPLPGDLASLIGDLGG